MDSTDSSALNDAIEQLWIKYLLQMQERIEVLEAADVALSAGLLSSEQRIAANSAAHKLAGVLGTFGLTKGTILAREAEIFFTGEPESDSATALRLSRITAELRAMIENRKPYR